MSFNFQRLLQQDVGAEVKVCVVLVGDAAAEHLPGDVLEGLPELLIGHHIDYGIQSWVEVSCNSIITSGQDYIMGDHDAMMQSHSVIELYKIRTGCSNLIFSQSIFLTNKNKSTSITEKIGDIKITKLFFLIILFLSYSMRQECSKFSHLSTYFFPPCIIQFIAV